MIGVPPFAEALASYDESQLEAETYEALRAEFEDEDFVPRRCRRWPTRSRPAT